MTGSAALGRLAGAQTLRFRQSSLCATPGGTIGGSSNWKHAAPYVVASRTPFQAGGGAGGRQRKLAVGGAANGMPLKAATPSLTEPRRAPLLS